MFHRAVHVQGHVHRGRRVAGVAAAPLLTVFPGMAEQMSLDAFVVVVVGGLGSLPGALAASLILGGASWRRGAVGGSFSSSSAGLGPLMFS